MLYKNSFTRGHFATIETMFLTLIIFFFEAIEISSSLTSFVLFLFICKVSSDRLFPAKGLSLFNRITLSQETPPPGDFISITAHTTLESLSKDDKRTRDPKHTSDTRCHSLPLSDPICTEFLLSEKVIDVRCFFHR